MKNRSPKFMFFFLVTLMPVFTMAKEPTEETPSLDFLEFLGEWSTQQNEWIDPSLMEKIENKDSNASKDSASTETGDQRE